MLAILLRILQLTPPSIYPSGCHLGYFLNAYYVVNILIDAKNTKTSIHGVVFSVLDLIIYQ